MWRFIKELPVEVAGSHVFVFLSVKDVTQMERAVIAKEERESLFNIVRSGPPLDAPLPHRDEPMYRLMCRWLCQSNLVMAGCDFCKVTGDEFEDLHQHLDEVHLQSYYRNALYLPWDSRLCAKIHTLVVYGYVVTLSPDAGSGNCLSNLVRFQLTACLFTREWVWDVLNANPALQTLAVYMGEDEELQPHWFDEAARRSGSLQDLRFYGCEFPKDERILWKTAEHCRALRKLTISGGFQPHTELPEEAMISITQECCLLEEVNVNADNVSTAAVTAICANCRSLVVLHIPDGAPSRADLLHLLPQHRKRPLTELECRWALQQESEVQACAALFSGLTTLRVTLAAECECAFTAAVSHLGGLRVLDITMADAEVGGADEALTAVAQHCRHLTEFSFEGTVVEELFLAAIAQRNSAMCEFRCWDFSGLGQDAVLHTLGRHCLWLEMVTCVGARDAAVQALAAGCRHLAVLRIHYADITDAALDALGAHCRRLLEIELWACPGARLAVTEAGLTRLLSACRGLRDLTIPHAAIDATARERIKSRHPAVQFRLFGSN